MPCNKACSEISAYVVMWKQKNDNRNSVYVGTGGMDVQVRFTDTTMTIRMTPSEGDFRQYRVMIRRLNSEE